MIGLGSIKAAFLADLTALLLVQLELPELPAGLLTWGREPQAVRRVLEVHVRPGPARNEAQGGGHQIVGHELDVLVRAKGSRENSQTGGGQLDLVHPLSEAVLEAFLAGPPTNVTAVEGVIGSSATFEESDADPAAEQTLQQLVRVTVWTNGTVLPEEEP